MASSDDEDLKLAIALSLKTQNQPEIIDLNSDEDETLLRPIKPAEKTLASGSNPGFLGLDRKKMEQERLARTRKPSLSPPPARKRQKVSGAEDIEPAQHDIPNNVPRSPSKITSSTSRGGIPEARFLNPVVKKTWAFGHPRYGSDIKLEEVLQKGDLKSAVLSGFQWDIDWLFAKLDTKRTQVTLVMQAKGQEMKDQYNLESADMPNLRLCFPSMEGQVNCMHAKLMLLSYPTNLRIAVPTANFVKYDWGESGEMENSVFLVDLPRLSPTQQPSPTHMTEFGNELIYFLKAMGLEASLIDSLSSFDFSATKDLAFVHTTGGSHVGDKWRRTGYCGLGRAVQGLGLGTDKALDIDFVASSIGSLNIDFLAMLYLAAKGDDGTKEYGWRNPDSARAKSKGSKSDLERVEQDQQKIKDEIRGNFRIFFPTNETVRASTARSAGTICFQPQWYNSPTFPRYAFRDCKSTRPGLLMHNKILYVRHKAETHRASANSACWAYIGSANCSESAWGKLTKNRALKTPKLNCRNWECGVVFPVRQGAKVSAGGDLSCFEGKVPVPMQYPGDLYGSRDPWYY